MADHIRLDQISPCGRCRRGVHRQFSRPIDAWIARHVLHRHLQQSGLRLLYDRKTPITAADLLNDRILSFLDQDVKLLRVLIGRGSEYCGNPEPHEYELYLAIEGLIGLTTIVLCLWATLTALRLWKLGDVGAESVYSTRAGSPFP